MSVDLLEQVEGKVLEVHITGKLSEEDYAEFVPKVEALIARHGKINVLVRMKDFHGWDAAALWEDIKFDARHFSDIERLALVGEKTWQKGMAVFCKPFTTAEVRYYEPDEEDRARAWVKGEVD
jgi:hypothetical protein